MDLAQNILSGIAKSNLAGGSFISDAGSYDIGNIETEEHNSALNSVVLTFAQGVPVTTLVRVSLLIALLALSALSLSRKR